MRRAPAIALFAVVAAGALALVVSAAGRDRGAVLDLGVVPAVPIAVLEPGQELCQGPIGLPAAVDRVTFVPAPGGERHGPLTVRLRATAPDESAAVAARGRPLAEGTLPRAVLSGGPAEVRFPRVGGNRAVALCVRNDARDLVQLWGDVDQSGLAEKNRDAERVLGHPTLSTSEAVLDGKPTGADLSARFPAREPRSLLALVPTMFEHAARFKPGGVGAWTYWVLLAAGLVVAPLLLARALRAALDADAHEA